MASVLFAPRGRWVLAVLATVAFEALLLTRPGSHASLAIADNVLIALAGLAAGLVAAHRGQDPTSAVRHGWVRLGTGCLLFSAGQVAFAVQVTVSGLRPPSGTTPADFLTVLAMPFAIAGLVGFAGPSLTTRLVTVLDASIIGAAFLFVSWAVVLGPAFRRHGWGTEALTVFVYVGGSFALLAFVLVLSMRWREDGGVLLLLGVAFAWISASNVAYSLASLRDAYLTGDRGIDVGWLASMLLIALAAARESDHEAAVDIRRRWLLTLFVPYASVLLVVITASVRLIRGADFGPFLGTTGILLMVLVLGRQALSLRDHHKLAVDLEGQVAERTAAAQRYSSQLRALLRDSSDVLTVVDDDGNFVYVSPASWSLFALPAEDLLGLALVSFVHPDDREATTAALRQADHAAAASRVVTFRLAAGQNRWCDVEATFSAVKEDLPGSGVLLNLRDVSERTAEQEELRQQALFDPLTSLPNRRVFDDRVHHALDRAQRTGECVSVLFVDLDHFKRVNDTAGHAIGDELLVQVADRLRVCLRPADTAARLGGDEFAVLLEGTTASQAQEVAGRVVAALSPPYALSDRTLVVTASVGVTTTEAGAVGTPELVRDADLAMYRAKSQGRARVEVFEPQTHAQRREQAELEDALRQALARGQMRVSYQPVVDLRSGEVTGMEALMRWERSPGDLMLPSRFLPLAGPQGLLQAMDRWVLREACRQLRSWQDALPGWAALRVSVNITTLDLHEPHAVEQLHGVLEETGLAPTALVLEIAESSVLPGEGVVSDVLARPGPRGRRLGRRLRVRALLARQPAAVPARRAQDRPVARGRAHGELRQQPPLPGRHPRHGASPGADHGRGSGRDPGAGGLVATARVRLGPGTALCPTAGA